jgi:hypothetical protein
MPVDKPQPFSPIFQVSILEKTEDTHTHGIEISIVNTLTMVSHSCLGMK